MKWGSQKNNSLDRMAATVAHDALEKAYDHCLMVPLRGLSGEARRRWVVRRLATKKTGGLLSTSPTPCPITTYTSSTTKGWSVNPDSAPQHCL